MGESLQKKEPGTSSGLEELDNQNCEMGLMRKKNFLCEPIGGIAWGPRGSEEKEFLGEELKNRGWSTKSEKELMK